MGFVVFLVVILLVAAVVAMSLTTNLPNMAQRLRQIEGHSRNFVSRDGMTGIAVASEREKMYLLESGTHKLLKWNEKNKIKILDGSHASDPTKPDISRIYDRVINFSDLLSVELVENDVTVLSTKTSRVSQAGGAIVGGLVFGPLGAVVGALSAQTETTPKYKRGSIRVRLVVNDMEEPVFELEFINRVAAIECASLMKVIIESVDAKERGKSAKEPDSIELVEKLFALREKGALSDLEFEKEKRRLLSPDSA